MIETTILYPYSQSRNFPKKVLKEFSRDNYINTVREQFEQNKDIVFITGEDELGKSTFLSQYTRQFPNETIACFIKPTNNFSSSIENIILS